MLDAHARRTERFDLRALYETSQLLCASLDLDFVLNSLLLTTMSKLLVTRGTVWLYDSVEEIYRVAAVKGLKGLNRDDFVRMRPPDAERLLGQEVPRELAGYGVELVLPITFNGLHIGMVGLGPKATQEPYQERELEFIGSLVNMSSTAVHNARMVKELQAANKSLGGKIQALNTLFDLSQEFNATVDRERLVKLLSFALMGQMLVNKQLFLLRRPSRVGTSHDLDDNAFEIVVSQGIAQPELEPELLERLAQLDTLLILQDEEIDAKWEGLRQRGVVLVLPLRQQGHTYGMLCLGPKMTKERYQGSDIEFLSSLGHLALASIKNSFLVEEQIDKKRLEDELRLARQIQERLLPQEIPDFVGGEVAARAVPSHFVGGDYFEVARLEGERLLLAIADVTGKGMPAALLVANLQACLHVFFPIDVTLEDATARINRVICGNTDYDKFITFFWGILHPENRFLRYVNAGHNPPMLVRSTGEIEHLETGGLLLGVMKDLAFEAGEVYLEPGDVLTLFTDGVTEAMSTEQEEYGEQRLEACLKAHRHKTAQEILDAVHADVRAFTDHASVLSDDLTMVVLRATDDQIQRAGQTSD